MKFIFNLIKAFGGSLGNILANAKKVVDVISIIGKFVKSKTQANDGTTPVEEEVTVSDVVKNIATVATSAAGASFVVKHVIDKAVVETSEQKAAAAKAKKAKKAAADFAPAYAVLDTVDEKGGIQTSRARAKELKKIAKNAGNEYIKENANLESHGRKVLYGIEDTRNEYYKSLNQMDQVNILDLEGEDSVAILNGFRDNDGRSSAKDRLTRLPCDNFYLHNINVDALNDGKYFTMKDYLLFDIFGKLPTSKQFAQLVLFNGLPINNILETIEKVNKHNMSKGLIPYYHDNAMDIEFELMKTYARYISEHPSDFRKLLYPNVEQDKRDESLRQQITATELNKGGSDKEIIKRIEKQCKVAGIKPAKFEDDIDEWNKKEKKRMKKYSIVDDYDDDYMPSIYDASLHHFPDLVSSHSYGKKKKKGKKKDKDGVRTVNDWAHNLIIEEHMKLRALRKKKAHVIEDPEIAAYVKGIKDMERDKKNITKSGKKIEKMKRKADKAREIWSNGGNI